MAEDLESSGDEMNLGTRDFLRIQTLRRKVSDIILMKYINYI